MAMAKSNTFLRLMKSQYENKSKLDSLMEECYKTKIQIQGRKVKPLKWVGT